MSEKKVLFFIATLGGGGAERVFVNLANEFAKNGVATSLLIGQHHDHVYLPLLREDVKLERLNFATTKPLNIARSTYNIRKLIKQQGYTHIIAAGDYENVAAVLACKFTVAEAIVTLHYNLPYALSQLDFLRQIWIKMLYRKVLKRASKIVAVSDGVKEGFTNITNYNSNNLSTIYNPVFDDSILQKGSKAVERVDLFEHKCIVVVGRLVPQKNPQRMLRVFAQVSQKLPQVNLVFLGKGDLLQVLKNLAQDLGVAKKVHFLGFQSNGYSYMAKANLLALSSDYEGLPTVLIEALALGVNIVSTNCPSGPAEILENGKYGWLVDVDDESDFANKILAALSSPMASNHLQTGAIKYHINIAVNHYLTLLH